MARKKMPEEALPEKIRVDGEIKRRENRYYANVADRYRICGFLMILLLAVLSGSLMLVYGEYITYDNFVYMMRDFDSVTSSGDNFAEVTYEAQERASFESFRDGFAVIGTGRVTLFDRTGVELCSESESFSYPAGSSSEKYLLAYDVGGKTYSIYNSVTRVMKSTTEKPIVSASVSDTGAYIITTESKDAKYLTELYTSAFRKSMTVYKDKYVIASAISGDGDTFALASVAEEGAELYTEISFYEKGKDSPIKSYTYSMAMPLSVTSFSDGGFSLLCDDGVRFYDNKGEQKNERTFDGETVSYFDASDKSLMLVCRTNAMGSENRVYSLDNKGKILYDGIIAVKATGCAASVTDGYEGYVISPGVVTALRSEGEHAVIEMPDDVLALTDTDGGAVVMTPDKAFRLFNKK